MKIVDLIFLSKKYNLSLKVNPEVSYITLFREIRIGFKTVKIEKYISYADFEILEDCMKYINDDINMEEVALINEHNRI